MIARGVGIVETENVKREAVRGVNEGHNFRVVGNPLACSGEGRQGLKVRSWGSIPPLAK